ncbi:MAG: DUF4011 domain-containing protein [Bacteroidetes bacterium]|nr:DUF4011 domain-containing protein [Bacteroidota bacterium]
MSNTCIISNSNTFIQTLQSLQKDLFDLSAKNPLVHIDAANLWLTDATADFSQAQKIYRKARFFEKEYGLHTTLYVSHFIRWKSPRRNSFFTAPLLCQLVQVHEKKRENTTYMFVPDESIPFVNPVLRKLFQDEFNLLLPEYVTSSPSALVDLLRQEFSQISIQNTFNAEDSWQIIEQNAIGIFNYPKILLARDYEKLIHHPGKAIQALLGEKKTAGQLTELPDFTGLLDATQQAAVKTALHGHTVIQGPPGTGKSHTLVALIKTLLLQKKKVLFVSEKRSALEVVYQRLKKDKLDLSIAFFDPAKDEKKQFYAQLKKNWEFATSYQKPGTPDSKNKPHGQDLFSYYPHQLLKIDPASGINIQLLLEKLIAEDFDAAGAKISGTLPNYKLWQEYVPLLTQFEQLIQHEFGVKELTDTAFSGLNTVVFSEPDPLRKLAARIDQLDQSLQKMQALARTYKLSEQPESFSRFAIAASILSMVNKNQLELLQKEHKKYKTFNTLAKKYQLTRNKLTQAELMNQQWSKKPSVGEITALNDLLKQKKKSKTILGILKRNSARSQDYFADFSPEISTTAKLQLLEEVRTEWHLKGELEALKIKLKHELHILNPDTEIDHILQVRTKLDSVTQNEYITLLEHAESLNLIQDLAGIHTTVNQCSGLIAYLFYQPRHTSFQDLKSHLLLLKDELDLIDQLQFEIAVFFKVPEVLLNFIRANRLPVKKLDLLITWQQLVNETRFEPAFKKLGGEKLLTDFETRKSLFQKCEDDWIHQIQSYAAAFLHTAEKLAETPASKLTAQAKQHKQNYREAKRMLVHEFSKRQQHLPVSELLQMHADTVISLQPLWMMNPLSVAQFLPCEEALFDYVIFDESSQIPLEDSLPAIYRGAHIVIVGDSQQMPPGQFFTSNPDGKTLLDQAEFNFTNVSLTHHYRSEHPSLIGFSNKHFYDFELQALPPVSKENPIQLIRTAGIFEDQRNVAEALEIARTYKSLTAAGKADIGILAFSREQQHEIEKQLALLQLSPNESLIIRNLENVQGIEKETVLISIGYAKNSAGIFRKNFGPVNQERGANRLNVLFTRAIQKMIVFSSVTAADFEMSDNRGTTLLADFLRYCEEQQTARTAPEIKLPAHRIVYDLLVTNQVVFDYYPAENGISVSCFIQHQTGKILLVDPCTGLNETPDFFGTLIALEKRFKKIKLITATDLLFNRKQILHETLQYFKL